MQPVPSAAGHVQAGHSILHHLVAKHDSTFFGAVPTSTCSNFAVSHKRMVAASRVSGPSAFQCVAAAEHHRSQLLDKLLPRVPAANALPKPVCGIITCRMLAGNFAAMTGMGDEVLKPFLQDVIQFNPLMRTMAAQVVQDPGFVPQLMMHVVSRGYVRETSCTCLLSWQKSDGTSCVT
jgi:hypothetical protein